MICYLKGDATNPKLESGEKGMIVHICNNVGAWGAGFVVPLGKRYPMTKAGYLQWHQWWTTHCHGHVFKLGEVQFMAVSNNILVANMIAQDGIHHSQNPRVKYAYLEICLKKAFNVANDHGYSVHMPRIGCGLGGGTWDQVEISIRTANRVPNVPVFVYDLEK